MRTTAWVGRCYGSVVEITPVAFCNCCRADRLLSNVRSWPGEWPEGKPAPIGECVKCGSTVSVTSRRPAA